MGKSQSQPANEAALRKALEAAGVEFIDENGEELGVRFRRPELEEAILATRKSQPS